MDRLRWGVLSTANIGIEKVIPAIQRAGNAEVVAIGSRDAGRADDAADTLGIPTAYGSYEAVLGDDRVDAVYIPLPNHLHLEWTLAAAAAGKHVLCEKPLALTSADAQAMVDACAAAGVVFAEAFMYRHHPTWVAVRELVASGRIGELLAIQTRFGYFNDDQANIRNQLAAGGGALMDIGCYAINLSRLLFGAEPDSIQAAIGRDPVGGTDIVTSAILQFGSGQASFVVSTRMEHVQRVEVLGSRGRIDVEIPFNVPVDRETRIHLFQGGDPPADPAVETFTFAPADPYTLQAEAFGRAVLDGMPLAHLPADGVANMKVIEAVFAAAAGE
jgi:predicted dehydrogenase